LDANQRVDLVLGMLLTLSTWSQTYEMCASQLCWNVSAGDCGLSCRFDRSLLCDGGDKHATSGL